MTKKDYKMVASIFGQILCETHSERDKKVLLNVINRFAIKFKDQNTNFDAQSFYDQIKGIQIRLMTFLKGEI